MFRCRSAASADHTGSSFYNLLHDPGKLIRLYIVIRFPVLLLRKSGIWLHNDRKEVYLLKSFRIGSICFGPSPQFSPSASTRSPSSIATTEGTSPPVRSFPLSSKIMVTNTGREEFLLLQEWLPLLHRCHSWSRYGSGLHRTFSIADGFCKCFISIIKIQISHWF